MGRVDRGKLGQVDGKVFHELRLGVTRGILGGCFALDGGGHAFTAIHLDTLGGAQATVCPVGFKPGTTLRGPNGRRVRCPEPERTIDVGLLGPNAQRLTYQASGRQHTVAPLGGVGAYLVVQRPVKPVMREYGFHHRDPKLNLHGPAEPNLALTPASQVIKRINYKNGTCVVRITMSPYGSCNAKAGFVPIPQPRVADVRTPVRAFAAPDRRGIRVRFRARQAVIDGRSGYNIELRPIGSRGILTQSYAHNVKVGDLVRTTIDLPPPRHKNYWIVVRYRTVRSRPGPYASLAYPGLLVGRARVAVPWSPTATGGRRPSRDDRAMGRRDRRHAVVAAVGHVASGRLVAGRLTALVELAAHLRGRWTWRKGRTGPSAAMYTKPGVVPGLSALPSKRSPCDRRTS